MEPVFIEKDQRRIEEEIDRLDSAVSFLQELYDALKAIGVTASLQELGLVTQRLSNANPKTEFLLDFVTNKLADKANQPNFNGVPIKRAMVLEMVDVPDLTPVVNVVKEHGVWQSGGQGFRVNLLTLVK
ncbi:hypothetical protein [Rufibacter sp. LB8]|uniref:hypothetical protein n=1 Tax=Rufibacter sp. LB8 TaxID=2777781 RepID=UPI00178C2EDB|nr:hypothetical protein [Rufibacter sp. LB8]